MDIDSVFQHLGDYFAFFVKFWTFEGFDELRENTTISPRVVTYLLAGIGLAYLIAFAKKFPGFEATLRRETLAKSDSTMRDAKEPDVKSNERNREASEFALLALLFFVGAVGLHICMLLTGWIIGVSWGSIYLTLNASLAMQAVTQPVTALHLRIVRVAKGPLYDSYPKRRQIITGISGTVFLYSGTVGLYGIVVVHEAPVALGLLSVFLSVILAIIVVMLLLIGLGWPAFKAAVGDPPT